MLKEEKAITLVALVITIIILLILSGIGTYIGVSSLKKAKDSKLSSELLMVQHATLEAYTKYITTNKVVKATLVGQNLTGNEAYIVNSNGGYYFKYDTDDNKIELKDSNISNYYLVSTKDDFQKLGITDATDSYVVNYETGEVMNVSILKNGNGDALYVSNN